MYLGVEMKTVEAIPVIKIISSVMFATCGDFKAVAGGGALKSPDVAGGVFCGDDRIFSGSFLASPPPWIP